MPVNPPRPPVVIPGTTLASQDFVRSALRLIGVLASGEAGTASELEDGLVTLNQMLDTWNAERLMVYVVPRYVWTPTSLKQTYTVGPGGDIDIPRPAKIPAMSVLSLNNATQPLELPLEPYTRDDWQSKVPVKNIQSNYPRVFYDDGAFPRRNVNVWPIPNGNLQLVFYWWSLLAQFQDLVTKLTFPPGYYEAIRYNLAIRMAPEYEKEPSQVVVAIAASAVQKIKAMNTPILKLGCDPAVVAEPSGGTYNWLTDTFQ